MGHARSIPPLQRDLPHSDVRKDGLTGDIEKIELLEACIDLSKTGQEKNSQLRQASFKAARMSSRSRSS